jgi:hypothetical protein
MWGKSLLEDPGFAAIGHALSATEVLRYRESAIQDIALRSMEARPDLPMMVDGIAATLPVGVGAYEKLIHRGIDVLRMLDIKDARYIAGAVIPKYASERPRPWHVDWWRWEDPSTQWPLPPQAGVIFYLDAVKKSTEGCLLTVPGSHRKEVPGLADSLDSMASRSDEQLVYVDAGDAVVIDARLLHGVSVKLTPGIRIAITLWYLCFWGDHTDRVRADSMAYASKEVRDVLGANMCPDYTGPLTPNAPIKVPMFRDTLSHCHD